MSRLHLAGKSEQNRPVNPCRIICRAFRICMKPAARAQSEKWEPVFG